MAGQRVLVTRRSRSYRQPHRPPTATAGIRARRPRRSLLRRAGQPSRTAFLLRSRHPRRRRDPQGLRRLPAAKGEPSSGADVGQPVGPRSAVRRLGQHHGADLGPGRVRRGPGHERIVAASSGGVLYGDVTEPADEDHPANPVSPYGISRLVGGGAYLRFCNREHGLTGGGVAVFQRLRSPAEPARRGGVVAIFCTRMFRGEHPQSTAMAATTADYVYVDDVAAANIASSRRRSGSRSAVSTSARPERRTSTNSLDHLRNLCQAELRRRGDPIVVPARSTAPALPGDLRSNVIGFRPRPGGTELDAESRSRRRPRTHGKLFCRSRPGSAQSVAGPPHRRSQDHPVRPLERPSDAFH